MFKVLIVDDERPARDTLSIIINWEKTDFRIIDTAKNGREAFEKYMIHKPDLIITDIQMPIMDGLNFIREVRKINMEQSFIILSCHEDFKYAREAIKMGVADYLIKDLLTAEDLYCVLEKVKLKLEKTRHNKTNNIYNKTELNINQEFEKVYKEAALEAVIFGNLTEDKRNEYINKLGLNLKGKHYVVMCAIIDDYKKTVCNLDYKEKKVLMEKTYNSIQEVLNEIHGGECYKYRDEYFIVIVSLEDTASQLKYISDCYGAAENFRRKIINSTGVSVTIGISKGFSNLDNVNERYKEALNITKYRMFTGLGKNLFYNTVLSKTNNLNTNTFQIRLNKIEESIENSNSEILVKEINNLYNKDIKGFMQYNYLKYINACMYDMIIKVCSRYNINYNELFNMDYIPIEEVEKIETVEEMSRWFSNVLIKIININKVMTCEKYSRRVKDAVEYIRAYYKEDISLSDIAETLGIHKVYLSRIFKEETGENITNYILKFRIEEAKKLLISTYYKIYEISEKVGFSKPQQFSVTFKKYTGLTPIEFRNKNL